MYPFLSFLFIKKGCHETMWNKMYVKIKTKKGRYYAGITKPKKNIWFSNCSG